MRSIILGALASLSLASVAAADTLVLAPQYATMEAPSNMGLTRPDKNFRAQFQYSASYFAGPATISGFAFRYDSIVDLQTNAVFDFTVATGFRIAMATATHDLDHRSDVFAQNMASDEITTLNHWYSAQPAGSGGTGHVKDFNLIFNFDTPFNYDPSQGDLILDLFLPTSRSPLTVDAINDEVPVPGVRGSFDLGGLVGRTLYGAPITQFLITPPAPGHGDSGSGPSAVPEPGAWALMLLGFGGIGALARRRARSDGAAHA